jgi:hypothetical protein
MPNVSLKLKPGVNVVQTPTLLEAGFQHASAIRFRDGLPEKIGGWTRYWPSPIPGVPRDVHAWQLLDATKYLAVASTTALNAIAGGSALSDITPQTWTTNPAEDFSTTNGDATVTIVDPGLTQEVTAGNFVYFWTPIAVGGLVLHGVYEIATRVDPDSYTIEAPSNATSTANNAGSVPVFDSTSGSASIQVTITAHGRSAGDTINLPITTTVGGVTLPAGTYTIKTIVSANAFTITGPNQANATQTVSMNSGNARMTYYVAPRGSVVSNSTAGFLGFGALGQFGFGQLSEGLAVVTESQTGTSITATNWNIDNIGEFLIAAPRNGAAYYWRPNVGIEAAALMSATAPIYNRGVIIDQQARIVIAYGSTAKEDIGISQDPLLIRWCDQEDFTTWTATTTNYAGSYRLSTGSEIVGALAAQRVNYIWTDLDIYAMQYIGGQGSGVSLVYAFQRLDTACGLVAQHAATAFAGNIFWMGNRNFFTLSGNGAQVIPCSVWDAVFQDLDTTNKDKISCVGNTPFNEVWFFYPSQSGGTGECDKYVKLNVLTGAWDHGPISGTTAITRTCGIDQSVLGMPIMASPTGYIYQHETTYNADGSAITWSWQTGDFALNEARDIAFVDEIYPDFKFGAYPNPQSGAASISMTLYGRNNVSDTPTTYGPYTVTSSTQLIKTRFRNRLMSIKVSGSDSASWSRLGNIRMRVATDGRGR